ncbi:alpha-L-arabinofuranosidase 1-like [Mangifera indica]|uniref:alpha-L-arabinofuranosidase 1-like n=1 Tax=Mangifera indica TaxID=29780 RepID=UPI001CFB538B|nr:alpha-L-arabinofuranosidase 1-like [Mangifera indica]
MAWSALILCFFLGACCVSARQIRVNAAADANQTTAEFFVDASKSQPMPETLFGIFFEEINHAGSGGLWAELVSNRGFEAENQDTSMNITPWGIIGDESALTVSTDDSSCFEKNKIALKMEVLCDSQGDNICPVGGVGVYNPGFWGMNIEQGKTYNIVFYVRSLGSVNMSVSFTSADGSQTLATTNVVFTSCKLDKDGDFSGSPSNGSTRKTSTDNFPKSAFILNLCLFLLQGHGFRNDLAQMLVDMKPRFMRFPGGCFVEGAVMKNAFMWKNTIGHWEERPGHYGDVWNYWTDDGMGYLEFLQLSEDLGAQPIWVFNMGIAHNEQINTNDVQPYVQDALDGIEFARGDKNSTWGSKRAALGHPEPFDLRYVAIGNEDCGKPFFRGNYIKFYDAIKLAYPDIGIISNCDGSNRILQHPADFYDFHIYTDANNLFNMIHQFDRTSRVGPRAFVSEYAVTGDDAGMGSLLASLAEAAFLLGIEKNSDIVSMASYAPLFVNTNDITWKPDAIVFNSHQAYGTPSYWMQHFFIDSGGANFLTSTLNTTSPSLIASAITYSADGKNFLKIKVVNFGADEVKLNISVAGLDGSINSSGSTKTILTSDNLMDENSFDNPNKVVPRRSIINDAAMNMEVAVPPHSFTSYDLLRS